MRTRGVRPPNQSRVFQDRRTGGPGEGKLRGRKMAPAPSRALLLFRRKDGLSAFGACAGARLAGRLARKRTALGGELRQQSRRSEALALLAGQRVEARLDLREPERVGIAQQPAAERRESRAEDH